MPNVLEKMQEKSTFNGLPYIGRQLNLKDNDKEERQPTLTHEAHIKIFDLSKQEDLVEYEAIWGKVMKGLSLIGKEDLVYDAEKKSWRVFVRWTDQFYTEPKETEGIINGK
jgi:hypothetical protein